MRPRDGNEFPPPPPSPAPPLALSLVPRDRPLIDQFPPTLATRARSVAIVVSLVLMAPIGFLYLAFAGLVAPVPDLFAAYALFGLLLAVTVWLARRRSWWVTTLPMVSVGLLVVLAWIGETYRDWSP